jgi:hypothetical protein
MACARGWHIVRYTGVKVPLDDGFILSLTTALRPEGIVLQLLNGAG